MKRVYSPAVLDELGLRESVTGRIKHKYDGIYHSGYSTDHKRLCRAELYLRAFTAWDAKARAEHLSRLPTVLMLPGREPGEEIRCIRAADYRSHIIALDHDEQAVERAREAGADTAIVGRLEDVGKYLGHVDIASLDLCGFLDSSWPLIKIVAGLKPIFLSATVSCRMDKGRKYEGARKLASEGFSEWVKLMAEAGFSQVQQGRFMELAFRMNNIKYYPDAALSYRGHLTSRMMAFSFTSKVPHYCPCFQVLDDESYVGSWEALRDFKGKSKADAMLAVTNEDHAAQIVPLRRSTQWSGIVLTRMASCQIRAGQRGRSASS